MKIFAFALCAAMLAAVSQAASVSWALAPGALIGSDGSVTASGSVYLLTQEGYEALEATQPSEMTEVFFMQHVLGSATIANGGTASATVTTDERISVGGSLAYLIALDGETFLTSSYYCIGPNPAWITGVEGTPSSTATFPTDTFTWTGRPPIWYELPENIPEPTSLALLALGVAAVGLRRKAR